MTRPDTPRLILASGSETRRKMLQAAGLSFEVVPAPVDERAIREELQSDDPAIDPAGIAEALASVKAETVSRTRPEALVIGSDQVLSESGEIFEKPASLDSARRDLMRLRGKPHVLHSAVALAQHGEIVWTTTEAAQLTMRKFSTDDLERYLARAGSLVGSTVGGYQIEGLGIQLMERVEGDHFTILGMPLLPLLAALRERGVLAL